MLLLQVFSCVVLCVIVVLAIFSATQALSSANDFRNYEYLINHPMICDKNDSQTVKVLLMIFSAPKRFEARESIRKSWGLLANRRDVKRLFLLALPDSEETQKKIYREDQVYNDIIQEDFVDSYRNLTLKSIMMVKWATTFCPQAEFLLKIDDDCFLNPKNFLKTLNNIKNVDEPLVFGQIFKNGRPHRNIKSKWYLSREEYPKSKYPDFISGPSYVHTRGAYPLIYEASLNTPRISLEDVYINGIVREKLNIPIAHNDGFTKSGKINLCVVTSNAVTYHDLNVHWHFPMMWWAAHDDRFDYCKKHDKRVKNMNLLIRKETLKR
ncbi:hypothetical protein CHUAL_005618 [Chamberlinius hualienensis]